MITRVAVVEDDARYRGSLETLLHHTDGFEVAGVFPTGEAVLKAIDDAPNWDLVLMDVELPGIDGIECTRRLKARHPTIRIVVLTVFEESATVLEAICAGADGYLVKRTSPARLVLALREVLDGGSPLSAGVAGTVLALLRQEAVEKGPWREGAARLGLTAREQDVLRCLVEGMSYKAVGDHLDISLDTVRSHVRGVYAKLQVHSVAEAVSRAIRERLV